MKKLFKNPIVKTITTTFKVVFVLQIVVLMVFVNFTVDISNFYHSGGTDEGAASLLANGQTLDNYDNLNERLINQYYIHNMKQPLDTIALGSSRILQLTKEIVGTDSFYNFGVSGGDFEDMLNTFFLLEEADMLPNNIIIGLDHWIFNPHPDVASPRSDKNLYKEFLDTKFGVNAGDYTPREEAVFNPEPLFDAAYFQSNLAYVFKNKGVPNRNPSPIESNFLNQEKTIKLSDGSVLYSKEFRETNADDIKSKAQNVAASFPGLIDMETLDPERLALFTRLIEHMRSRGINVVFVLTPYHPFVYNYISFYKDDFSAFFGIEPFIAEFAAGHSIPVYGSYNPSIANCFNFDFYDGWHLKRESLSTIIPAIGKIERDIKSGQIYTADILADAPISIETAYDIILQTYPAPSEYTFEDKNNRFIHNEEYYIITRNKGEKLIDTFAVCIKTGYLYRLDMASGRWVYECLQ